MGAVTPPIRPPVTAAEPVRIAYVLYGLTQTIIAVLLIAETLDARVGGICTGVAAAVYAAVSELFVRPGVIPVGKAAVQVEEALYTPVPEHPEV